MSLFTTIKERKRYNSGYSEDDAQSRRITKFILGLIIVIAAIFLFSPALVGVKVEVNEENVQVKTLLTRTNIEYSNIIDITLVEEIPSSKRKSGSSSLGLDVGKYVCDEYGEYYRATYSKNKQFIIIKRGDNNTYFIFNCAKDEDTIATYNTITNYLY